MQQKNRKKLYKASADTSVVILSNKQEREKRYFLTVMECADHNLITLEDEAGKVVAEIGYIYKDGGPLYLCNKVPPNVGLTVNKFGQIVVIDEDD